MNTLKPGQLVYWNDEAVVILELKSLQELIVRNIENNRTDIAHIKDINTAPLNNNVLSASHVDVDDKKWDKATERFEIIKPLIAKSNRTVEDVKAVADKSGKNTITIYRWLKRYKETGLVSSLLRPTRVDKGNSRLDDETEAIIQQQIDEYYLKKERPSITQLYRRIQLSCRDVDIEPPHKNTVYARANSIDERKQLSKRYSPKKAQEKFEPLKGKFPATNTPLSVVQIDHTKCDMIIVDTKHRLPIARPYMTIAIDVATKMICGFTLTLDPPGASSAGLCISQSISRKEVWLAKKGIDAEWPIYGKMEKIHLDNAKEFRGKMLHRACDEYNIILENRPRGMPNYGPHVERAFRTYMQECHAVPGTTFSNVKQRVEYNSEGQACMTLDDLKLWFTYFILYWYHNEPHKGNNGMPPIKMYQQLVFGSETVPGCGIPEPVQDERKVQLDFTPYLERTIQRSGVLIDYIHYYSPVLRRWVGLMDKETNKGRLYVFVRDPRDISTIYFLEPDTKNYVPIPYLNSRHPALSLWELRHVEKMLKEQTKNKIDENMIFHGLGKMREIEQEAIERTRLSKQQRANEKRKRTMSERRTKWKDIHPKTSSEVIVADEQTEDIDFTPFNDIEID